jgi:chromosome segregation ATPase
MIWRSKMIDRYDIDWSVNGYSQILTNRGEWCKYEDIKDLINIKAPLDETIRNMRKQIQELEEKLKVAREENEKLKTEILVLLGACTSKGEARRIIKQGAYKHVVEKIKESDV